MATVLWLNQSWAAAVPAASLEKENWLSRGQRCGGTMSQLLLAGEFRMPSPGETMKVSVGRGSSTAPVRAVIKSATGCEAVCSVQRFERYAKNSHPAFMDLECESSRLGALRMPVQIAWAMDGGVSVRLGSVLYGVEESRLRLSVDRYARMSKLATR